MILYQLLYEKGALPIIKENEVINKVSIYQ